MSVYHSLDDVRAEMIRINAVVDDTDTAWIAYYNQADPWASGDPRFLIDSDWTSLKAAWRGFTNSAAASGYANLPDEADWNTAEGYLAQIQAVQVRMASYPSSVPVTPSPNNAPPGSGMALSNLFPALPANVGQTLTVVTYLAGAALLWSVFSPVIMGVSGYEGRRLASR